MEAHLQVQREGSREAHLQGVASEILHPMKRRGITLSEWPRSWRLRTEARRHDQHGVTGVFEEQRW